MENASKLHTERQAAELLNLSPATLKKWRVHDKGPRCVRLGVAIRYHIEDLEAFAGGRGLKSSISSSGAASGSGGK